MVELQPHTVDSNAPTLRQWMSIGGICLMVCGVFSSALGGGLGQTSLIYRGNTIAAIVLGISAASAWSLNRCKRFRVLVLGVLAFIVVASDLISLWSIDLNVSGRPSAFGFADRHLIAKAWVLMSVGAVLQIASAWESRLTVNEVMAVLADPQAVLWIRVVVQLIGLTFCLMGVFAFANDIPAVRSALCPFADYALIARCAILALLIGTCLVSFRNAPVLNIWSRPLPRLVYGVLWGPVIAFSLFLISTLQLDDFAAMIVPGIAFVATGEGIASRSYCLRLLSAACNLLILVGALFVLVGGVPNEVLAILGLERHEGVVVLGIIVLWSLFVAVIQLVRSYVNEPCVAKTARSGAD